MKSGLPYTILRPNFFMDNLLKKVESIVTRSTIEGAMGNGRLGMIDTRDIVDVVSTVLCDPAAHVGKIYSLTGPASISLIEIAATLTRLLGRQVSGIGFSDFSDWPTDPIRELDSGRLETAAQASTQDPARCT
jgi:uncharacterized protein YbjT (DUF2867 family)